MTGQSPHQGSATADRLAGIVAGAGFLALLLTLAVQWQRAATSRPSQAQAKPPAVGFDPPAHDYGTVVQATNVSYTFQLFNRTTNQLKLVALKSSCDCTVVSTSLLGQLLKPNESVPVPVSFKTGPRVGPIVSTLEVVLQGERGQYLAMAQLSGTIWPDYSFEPRAVDFGEVRPGVITNSVVAFKPVALKEFALIPRQSSEGPFQVAVHPKELAIAFHAPTVGHRETLARTLVVETTSRRVPSVTIPVSATVVPEVSVSPGLIVLAPGLLSQTSRFTLESEWPARLRGVMLDGGGVMPREEPVLPADWRRSHAVEVKNAWLAGAPQIIFQLDVQTAGGRTEARSLAVQIKRLKKSPTE